MSTYSNPIPGANPKMAYRPRPTFQPPMKRSEIKLPSSIHRESGESSSHESSKQQITPEIQISTIQISPEQTILPSHPSNLSHPSNPSHSDKPNQRVHLPAIIPHPNQTVISPEPGVREIKDRSLASRIPIKMTTTRNPSKTSTHRLSKDRLMELASKLSQPLKSEENSLKLSWINPQAARLANLMPIRTTPVVVQTNSWGYIQWKNPGLFGILSGSPHPVISSIKIQDGYPWVDDYLLGTVEIKWSSSTMANLLDLGFPIQYEVLTDEYQIKGKSLGHLLKTILLGILLEDGLHLDQVNALSKHLETILSSEWSDYQQSHDDTQLKIHRYLNQTINAGC